MRLAESNGTGGVRVASFNIKRDHSVIRWQHHCEDKFVLGYSNSESSLWERAMMYYFYSCIAILGVTLIHSAHHLHSHAAFRQSPFCLQILWVILTRSADGIHSRTALRQSLFCLHSNFPWKWWSNPGCDIMSLFSIQETFMIKCRCWNITRF